MWFLEQPLMNNNKISTILIDMYRDVLFKYQLTVTGAVVTGAAVTGAA